MGAQHDFVIERSELVLYLGTGKDVVIPEGVKRISDHAFDGCEVLESLTFPSTAEDLDDLLRCWDNMDCRPPIKSLHISEKHPMYYCEGNCLIEKGTGKLLYACPENPIPEGVATFDYAAMACSKLPKVTIPESVESVGSALGGMGNLRKIVVAGGNTSCYCEGDCLIEREAKEVVRGYAGSVIPEDVSSIGDCAFENSPGLERIRIPAGVTQIVEGALRNCPDLEQIEVAQANPAFYSDGNCLIRTEDRALVHGCKKSNIPCDVTAILDSAFEGCTGIKYVTIPEGVTSIGCYAFAKSGIVYASIPKSVTEISDYAFSECASLKSIEVDSANDTFYSEGDCLIDRETQNVYAGCKNSKLPADVKEIAMGAFQGCTGLGAIGIPASVTCIWDYAFYGCSGLSDLYFEEGELTRIEMYAFARCTSLKEVSLPLGLEEIGECAFSCCGALEHIELPASLKGIGVGAFQFCTSLTEIAIPSGVKEIGAGAFLGCTSLKKVAMPKHLAGGLFKSKLEEIFGDRAKDISFTYTK